MKKMTGVLKLSAILTAASLFSGCLLEKKEDGSKFREAIPEAERVKVSGPEDTQAQASSGGKSAPLGEGSWDDGPWAKWYGFTRAVRQGVNQISGVVLGSVWIIVHTQPTSVSETEAIWGPWTDSLEPATYRFRVTEVAENDYDYVLEGRPKASQSDADYRPVLFGKGYGKADQRHGDGYFTIDLDAARELDPFNADADDSGTVKVTHDLPPDITTNIFSQPRAITADVHPSKSEDWFTVTSKSAADGTGTLVVNAFADADDSNLTQREDISVVSEWNGQGAGRADITITGGDVPESIGIVTAVECWGTDFYRVYYSDSVSYEPAEGDPSACAFSLPAAP